MRSTWRADRIRNPNTALVLFCWQETKPTNQTSYCHFSWWRSQECTLSLRRLVQLFLDFTSSACWKQTCWQTPPPPQKKTCRAELSEKSAACFLTTHLLSLLIQPYLSKCHMVHSVLPLLFPSNTDLRSGMVSRKTGAHLPGCNHTHRLTYGGNNCSQRGPICLFLIYCVVCLNLFVPLFFGFFLLKCADLFSTSCNFYPFIFSQCFVSVTPH